MWPLAVLLVLVLADLAGATLLEAGLVDDSYIFLRYAENVASGIGPVFNPGERVEGYTSPLWMLTLAAAARLGLDLVPTARLLGAGLGLATLALVAIGPGRRLLPGGSLLLAFLPAWFLATNPSFLYWTWSGMETALFTFLFTGSFFSFLRDVRSSGGMEKSGIWFALAVLTRPDMLALLPVYLLALAAAGRDNLLRRGAGFLLPLALPAVHVLWRLWYYGALLPNTFSAKVDVQPGTLLEGGLRYTARFVLAYDLHLVLALAAAALLLRPGRRPPRELLLGAAIAGIWAVYVTFVGGDHFGMFRFYVPLLPLLAWMAAALAGWCRPVETAGPVRSAWMAGVALLALVGINLSAYSFHGGTRGREEVALARQWSAVGLWLRENFPPGSTIALAVAGAIPYHSGLPALDLLGLTDREIATRGKVDPQGRVGHRKYDTDSVIARRPELILYQSSGLTAQPLHGTDPASTASYPKAFRDLVTDPRVRRAYEYRAFRMDNGRVAELLQLRGSAGPVERP